MFWNKYFRPSFYLMLLVVALHWVASCLGFYWTVEWYDFVMHFLGGLWVFVFTLWVLNTGYFNVFKKYISIRNMIIFVFVFGVAWEGLELFLRFTNISDFGYTWDTSHDLIMDTLGACLGAFLYRKSLIKK